MLLLTPSGQELKESQCLSVCQAQTCLEQIFLFQVCLSGTFQLYRLTAEPKKTSSSKLLPFLSLIASNKCINSNFTVSEQCRLKALQIKVFVSYVFEHLKKNKKFISEDVWIAFLNENLDNKSSREKLKYLRNEWFNGITCSLKNFWDVFCLFLRWVIHSIFYLRKFYFF